MKAVLAVLPLTAAVLTSANAQVAPLRPPQPPASYVALALADGPTADQRLVISIRGSDANAVVASAYRACYQRAAQGYMHTCQVWYGDAWIVGTMCAQPEGGRRFAIGDDATSPDAADTSASSGRTITCSIRPRGSVAATEQ